MEGKCEVDKLRSCDLSRAGMSAFLAIASAWRLTDEEAQTLLGAEGRSTFRTWKAGQSVVLPEDVLKRISCVLGIFKSLNMLFSDSRQADEWIRRPNVAQLFAGCSALERMLAGDLADLLAVRNYLDAQVDCALLGGESCSSLSSRPDACGD